MLKDKILLNMYKKMNKVLGGRGLTKYPLIVSIKNFALANLRSEYAYVQGHKMILDSKDCLQLSINEIYEPAETDIIKQEIKKGDIVLDIGANIGYYTLLMADLVGDNGKVFAFEPEPYNFELLRKNIEINTCKNVILEKKAISNCNKRSNLYLSRDNTGMHRLNESKYCEKHIEVDVVKLDDFFRNDELINKIKFIKIDVEGSELDVLQGMESILEKNNQITILLEFIPEHLMEHGSNPIHVIEFLLDRNFRLYTIVDNKKEQVDESNVKEILNYSGRSLLCVRA